MGIRLDELINFIEIDFADIKKQAPWDNSGVQVYLGDGEVANIYLSLDLTDDVLDDAIKKGCEVIITHHPVFFLPSKCVDVRKGGGRLVAKAIKNNINILSYHTNIDISPNGINHYIATLLNAKIIKYPLSTEINQALHKIQTFIPTKYKSKILEAINKINKTTIGNYTETSFSSIGEGRFTANKYAKPFIGEAYVGEAVEEVKLELTVDKDNLSNVVSAIRSNHPYEEAVIDIIPLQNSLEFGFGVIAKLDKKYKLAEFIKQIQNRLNVKNVRTNMADIKPFDKVAISSGSSVSSYKDCIKNNINVLLTGDMKHHDAIDAYDAGVCVIDATHQYSEMLFMKRFGEVLKDRFDVKFFVGKERDKIINWG